MANGDRAGRGTNSGRADWTGESLTAAERETLTRALELGYFEVPRRITLSALAEDLERPDVAVSEELRRGVAVVLRRDADVN
jgi:predicted DNA binding protein